MIRTYSAALFGIFLAAAALGQDEPGPLGATPPADAFPQVEFAFEARITLAPPVVLGRTARGHRQYIPITGGTIAGPRLNGRVIPGGWDFQLRYDGGCGTLTADYFLEADDGTVIHILNEMINCGSSSGDGARSFSHPKFEAPEGPHDWLTDASFAATIEIDAAGADDAATEVAPPRLEAIRIKFYQLR